MRGEIGQQAARSDVRTTKWAAVVCLLVLAPVCAEYLAAYDDSTGDPGDLLLGLAFLVPLYGCRPCSSTRSLAAPG